MPFQVPAHPEYLPAFLGTNICRFGDRVLPLSLRVLPLGSDLKDLYALTLDSIADIDLVSNLWRRTASLKEFPKLVLTAFNSSSVSAMARSA